MTPPSNLAHSPQLQLYTHAKLEPVHQIMGNYTPSLSLTEGVY